MPPPPDAGLPPTTGALLAGVAARFPARIALRCGGQAYSYADLDALANRVAHAVVAATPAGGRVAILARNGIAYAAAHFGVARSGRVLAHLAARTGADELAGLLSRLEPALLLVDETTAVAFAGVRGRLASPPRAVTVDVAGDGGAALEAFVAGFPASPSIAVAGDDPFCIQFTGGTTGRPKGVVLTHRARLVSTAAAAEDYPLAADDIGAVNVPLCHAAGLFSWFQPLLHVGATAVLPAAGAPADLASLVAEHGVSAAFMVPTQLAQLLDHPAFDPAAYGTLRLICCGGAPTPPALQARCAQRLPEVRLVIAYGSTETGHLLACPPAGRDARPGALGKPGPRIALAVRDADGRERPAGEVGEITTEGPQLLAGYLDDPAEQAAYFRDGTRRGWTGDLARVDADGTVVMAGRRKEMILCGGLNIFPAEIEQALAGYPGLADCAAFGVPDPEWGELPAVAVIAAAGAAIDSDALLAYAADRLARHKRPRRVLLLDDLPRTAAGKVRRNRLAELLQATHTMEMKA